MDVALRVALVGLGDIAAKAYLPVLGADDGVAPVLVTRDPVVRARLCAAWRVPEAYARVEDAIAAGPALDLAFVHTATAAHPAIVGALLDAGVAVCVDKPLADSAPVAADLVRRARARRVPLAVAFNRRYAPAYAQVAAWPGLHTIVVHKHRHAQIGAPRAVVFDDFIHVLDTLRFLVCPQPDQVDVSAVAGPGGSLARVAVVLRQGERLGIGVMDRDSGSTQEVLDALAPGRRRRVTELTEVVDHAEGVTTVPARDGWAAVPVQRGFAAMVAAVLGAVRAGTVLDAGDALATHELCEEVVTRVAAQLGPA